MNKDLSVHEIRSALTDRLYGDAVAAGLRVPAAFSRSRTAVRWADVVEYLRERASLYRDELSTTPAQMERAIDAAREKWKELAPVDQPCREVTLLSRAARTLLRMDGREMILRVDDDEPGREILRWRFVSLALPPGILIAAATPRGFAPPDSVRLLNPSIAPDGPVALNHVHHAAMMSFEDLWASLRLRALLRPGNLVASLRHERAFCPRLHHGECLGGKSELDRRRAEKDPIGRARHMAEWGDSIRQAFIAGRVLDHHAHHSARLKECSDCAKTIGTTLRSFLDGRTKPYSETGTPYPWPPDELIQVARRFRAANAPGVLRRSHLPRTNLMREQTAKERSVLARAFAYVSPDQDESPDPDYEKLFLQYLRVKTAVFGLLVHPPGEPGLANFLDHFLQIKVYAPESDQLRPPSPHEPGLRVLATEYRVAPDALVRDGPPSRD